MSVGRPAQLVEDTPASGGDVAPDGRLLSVAELQQAYRGLLRSVRAGPAGGATHDVVATGPAVVDRAVPAIGRDEPGIGSAETGADTNWITVLAAHSGADASTIALAVADAAAAEGSVHLVETADPARSGLVAASISELGIQSNGWRLGVRGKVTIHRRPSDRTLEDWSADPAGAVATVIDLGLPSAADLARLVTSGAPHVVVCRATVPGVRLCEQTLDAVGGGPVAVAVLGPGRWPGEVTSSLGPQLRRLCAEGRVVRVPLDRHFEVTGPTQSPLPRPLLVAGRSLLGLINAARLGDTTTSARAPRTKETTR